MKPLGSVAALVLLLLGLAASVAAGPLEDGGAAFDRGDFAAAARLFHVAADQGEALAQAFLGLLHASGRGVPQDYAEAANWYRLAAEQGHAFSQENLGRLYYHGSGVPQDYVEALKWTRLAADQGDADAQRNLGIMYSRGVGVPQNYVEALKWTRLAADQGDAIAQMNLGVMYGEGRSVAQNNIQAHLWSNLAASRMSAAKRAGAVENRDKAASEMTPQQILEAQRLAREWKPRGDARDSSVGVAAPEDADGGEKALVIERPRSGGVTDGTNRREPRHWISEDGRYSAKFPTEPTRTEFPSLGGARVVAYQAADHSFHCSYLIVATALDAIAGVGGDDDEKRRLLLVQSHEVFQQSLNATNATTEWTTLVSGQTALRYSLVVPHGEARARSIGVWALDGDRVLRAGVAIVMPESSGALRRANAFVDSFAIRNAR